MSRAVAARRTKSSATAIALAVIASRVTACTPKVDEAAVLAGIQRCVAKQSGRFTTSISGNPAPEVRKQFEEAAKKAEQAHNEMLRATCERTVRDACKNGENACKNIYAS